MSTPTVLFVCARNSGKSQMAAALMRQLAGECVEVHSAGTDPGAALNPLSLQVLDEVGARTAGEAPKPIDAALLARTDLVVVLGREARPRVPGGVRIQRWDTVEPSQWGVDGIERMRLIRDDITARAQALLAELDIPSA
ncbi:low molecular weight phosphatase family protein [Nocardia sp. 2YAB30]|uniref:arsenate-mycothiol transferase ArsC n=1 Tax=Nocardia sp. 2YAB30 TaxID=3233022 RepID=UPI003F94AF1D